MTDHFDETFAPDVSWTCGLCNANGRKVSGEDRESLEMHMNEHIAGALEDPIRMIFDLRVSPLPRPEPKLVDVVSYGPGWGLVEYGTTNPVLALIQDQDVAAYLARLWNEDQS
jgi:hypothetical protein